MIGTVIDGSYRVDRLIGEGAFGVVYECTELALDRLVAIKMLRATVAGERDLRRFQAEGRNLATLNHSNVVHIYRLGNYEGNPYIVMELVRGQPLKLLLQRDQPPIRRVLEIMREVAAGLGAIHAMDIVHRDLSLNNIVVTENGKAKLLDLGLSRAARDLTSLESRGYLVGTLLYVSPEQIEGHETRFSADVFSFGVILYEALTGVHPFRAEHQMSLLYNIAHRDAEPLTTHLPHCPETLAELVARCLEKVPDRRPVAAEVERGLAEILARSDLGLPAGRPLPHGAGPAATPRNPYLNRVMIKHPENFFGRGQEIKRIYARLNATPPGSISIVGDRKIGKSSLLNYVYNHTNRRQYLEQPEKTVMVFLDLQQEKGMSMESFVRALVGIADLELRGRVDLSECPYSLDGIRTAVQRLNEGGYRLIILLDEFEAVTANTNFNLEFFSFLRFLANHYDVAYVTSSARDLQVLCHTKEIADSPFFNIFSTMRLSVFQLAEAEELVRIPSERVGKPLKKHTKQILEMAGLFPFFIQMACSHAVEYLEEQPDATEPDFREVGRRFFDEAKLHFRYIWDGFDVHERSTVLRVTRGRGLPDALKHVLAELEARHYVEGDGHHPRLFSSAFDEFVKIEGGRKTGASVLGRLFGRAVS